MPFGLRFANPERLVLVLLVCVSVVALAVIEVRRRRLAARFAAPARWAALVAGPAAWRFLLVPLFVAGALAAALGAAQPTVPGEVEREQATVVIAIDVSDSMAATDVRPDRITAATRAAASFVADLPASFHVGLVTAGASPVVVVEPTTDHERVTAALDRLRLSPGTALGDALFTALALIPPPPPEEEVAGAIVLLSDGVTTTGRPDEEAIEAASEAGVPVSTIAFGTNRATVHSQGQTVEVPVDESAMRAIADGTGGEFYRAESAAALSSVYRTIDSQVTLTTGERDVAEWFAGAALAILLVAVAASIITTGRVTVA